MTDSLTIMLPKHAAEVACVSLAEFSGLSLCHVRFHRTAVPRTVEKLRNGEAAARESAR